MDKVAIVEEVMLNRRSVFPKMYNKEKEIPKEEIWSILQCADNAPTHRLTQPWRFKVITGETLQQLSNYLGNYYHKYTPAEKYSALKYKKTVNKPLQSSCVIAICMQRDPEERVPEWEEIAATAMAVQNMWLSCSARGIGCYWSSPQSIINAREFLGLKEGERCLGLLYMGYAPLTPPPSPRSPLEEKVDWI